MANIIHTEHVHKCPKCKNVWFKKEETVALAQDKKTVISVVRAYTCTSCGYSFDIEERLGE